MVEVSEMKTKILRVRTERTPEGNIRPAICSALPHGMNYVVLEYNEDKSEATVKLAWSEHPLAEAKPTTQQVNRLLSHEAVLKELTSHPLADQLKISMAIHETKIKAIDETAKTLTIKEHPEPLKFVRKEPSKDGGFSFVFDEG